MSININLSINKDFIFYSILDSKIAIFYYYISDVFITKLIIQNNWSYLT